MPPGSGTNTTGAPPEPSKKVPGLLWLILVLAVVVAGGGAYILSAQLQKPVEQVSVAPPRLITEEREPQQGFNARPVTTSAPGASPTITSTDSVSDIEKDLMGTTIEGENTTEFDADLQSL